MKQTCTQQKAWETIFALLLPFLGFFALGGCTVGPDYTPPQPELPDAWTTQPQADVAQADEEALSTWWNLLDDPLLSSLVEKALKSNLGLRQSVARIEEARALKGQVMGLRVPSVGLDANAGGSRLTETGVRPAPESNPTDFYDAGVGSTWEVDVFGRVRRLVEASEASFKASIEDYRNIRVILVADVASEYSEFRSLNSRIKVAERNMKRQRKALDLARSRYNAGVVSQLDVSQAAYNLALTESLIPLLQVEAEVSLNRLSFLLGEYPGTLDKLRHAGGDQSIPDIIPDTGLPRNLLRRRPDIRRQERLLAAQTARIGVARAELYPRFDLAGFIGISTNDPGTIFDARSGTWFFGLPVSWNIFSGGRLQARVSQEEARTETALLAYQETVLSAVTEVESAVVSIDKLLAYRAALEKAHVETRTAAKVVSTQYENGVIDFQRVLDVDRNILAVENDLAVVNGALMKTQVRLYRSLGGGWSPEGDSLMLPETAGNAETL